MRIESLVVLVLAGFLASAPVAQAQAPLWMDVAERSLGPSDLPTVPRSARYVRLDQAEMARRLASAPVGDLTRGVELTIPLPEGGRVEVRVAEASVMAPALQARYPAIRTYLAQGPGSVHGRLSLTPEGFAGMLFTPEGALYIDRYARDGSGTYIAYRARDLVADKALRGASGDVVLDSGALSPGAKRAATNGATLRTYRLAVAATGEYTQFHGGTVAGAMAAIVTTMNRVAGLYERDFSVTFELVANNDQVVYTNAGTDPYSNSNGGAMLSQNQSTLDSVIGSSKYDIGHVFSTGGGGVAYLGSVCGSDKAGGVTGSGAPVGDAFDVDYVAHEMGHQFGGNHTFNGSAGSCGGGNRNGPTAYEPGSGSTIMAYAGICGAQNLQSNSDPLFHVASLDEVTEFITSGGGSTCGTATATHNPIPSVSATGGYTIPVGTPFTLAGSATDNTPGALTYIWEGFSRGSAGAPGRATPPYFRSFTPSSSPERTFPQLDRLLAGQAPVIGETYPSGTRSLDFRLTARDNRAGGGAIDAATVTLDTDGSAGPFLVTFATTAGASFNPGPVTVTWDVAGTDGGSVNTSAVDILLSTDGGASFGTVLASATPNDGSQSVSLPAVATTQARVLIRAVGNVFFNVNPEPFEISSDVPAAIAVAPGTVSTTLPGDATGSERVTISNTAAAGAQSLTWSASLVLDQPEPKDRVAPAPEAEAPKGAPDAARPALAAAKSAGGPDAFGYTWADSDEASGPAVAFQDISGTGTALSFSDTDDGVATVALPFAFPFYGTDRTSVTVATNGFLQFASSSARYNNKPIPTTSSPHAVIAPFWDDLTLTGSSAVYVGALLDGRFVIQFHKARQYSDSGARLTFQVLLSPDGTIEVQYGTMAASSLTSATVGIENDAGTDGLEVVFNGVYVASNMALRFRPQATWIAASPSGGSLAPGASAAVTLDFDTSGLDDGTYTATLRVTSNDPATPSVDVPVTLSVGAAAPVSIVVDGSGRSLRFFGPPAAGVTIDDLAAQNIVRGVPGYYPTRRASLWTAYDAALNAWAPSTGTGEVLRLGHAFRWKMFDIEGQGDPEISEGHALPFTLVTSRPPNTADVEITLDTGGKRFNFLANPFGTPLDLTGLSSWPGAGNVGATATVYDPDSRSWSFAPAQIAPWVMFRVRARSPLASGEDRVLTIPASARVTGPSRQAPSSREAGPSLVFRLEGALADGRGPLADGALAFRFDADARAAFDDDEDLRKPQAPAEAFLALGARAAAVDALVAEDVRPFSPVDVPLALVARGAAPSLVLTWDGAGLPAGLPVGLVDLVTGAEIDLRTHSRYAFEAPSRPALDGIPLAEVVGGADAADRFVLRIGARLASAPAAVVTLGPVAPNPSTDGARVPFVVAEAGPARLTVVDARGREVAVLADGPLAAGRHEVRLPVGLASGVYLVRLATDDALLTRTVAIVR